MHLPGFATLLLLLSAAAAVTGELRGAEGPAELTASDDSDSDRQVSGTDTDTDSLRRSLKWHRQRDNGIRYKTTVPKENNIANANYDAAAAVQVPVQVPVPVVAPPNANRLYCMVPFVWTTKSVSTYQAIKETWGKRCDVLRFMIDPIVRVDGGEYIDVREPGVLGSRPSLTLPEDVVVIEDMTRMWHTCGADGSGTTKKKKKKNKKTDNIHIHIRRRLKEKDSNKNNKKNSTSKEAKKYFLNQRKKAVATESCRNIWEKLWRSWVWVDSNEIESAEWFIKVDSDTYLFPENLIRYVQQQNWSPEDYHYFGHKLDGQFIAGAAATYSRATLRAATSVYRSFPPRANLADGNRHRCEDRSGANEELSTALCLSTNFNVKPETALDDDGMETISLANIEEALLWNRKEQGEWWYWKNKPKVNKETKKEMHGCCSNHPIAFHGYKDPRWFYKFESEFYNEGQYGSVPELQWRNADSTTSYFDRVREAKRGGLE